MTRISSKLTVFYKLWFPIIWFGFLLFIVVTSLIQGVGGADIIIVVVPLFMAAFGFFLFKHMVWDVVDTVHDCGDSLVIENSGETETIALSEIINVSASTVMNPPKVTLRLNTARVAANEISFIPAVGLRLNPFAKIPIVEDLIVRVDEARSRR